MEMENKYDVKPAEESARELANAFAGERVQGFVDDVLDTLIDNEGEGEKQLKWTEAGVHKVIGRVVAIAYFKGYMDRAGNNKINRLYL